MKVPRAILVAAVLAGCAPAGGGRGGRRVQTVDRDRDGKPDRWITWRDGEIVSKELDLNYDGKPDTRMDFTEEADERGRVRRLVAESRDTDHDGKADLWKSHVDGNVMSIREDRDRDGRADRERRFSKSGRLVGLGTDTKGDGAIDQARRFGPRGETLAISYDTDGDGRFETVAEFDGGSGGKPRSIIVNGKKLSPGHFYHTRGIESRIVGFVRDSRRTLHLKLSVKNTGAKTVKLPERPGSIEFHLRDADATNRSLSITSDVPGASGKTVELDPGAERVLTFPVDFRAPQGSYRIRATVNWEWNENRPTSWTGRSVSRPIDFDGRVGKME